MVAGRRSIVEWLRQRGRPFLFSSAMTAPDVAACIEATAMLQESSERVERLWSNAALLKSELQKMGFDTGLSRTPIVPVMLGEAPLAQEFSRRLFAAGVFAMAIGFPTVPTGKARIRVMNSAAHSQEDLEVGLAAFEKIGRELGMVG
ncbi:MAG TPA: aminotransferase class I/II-fold pyridoxal phosphate-dependent enzyme, partial [Caldilineaceae bacterium]|nr:aminotransferase class I/II-fold pyridoxal phosphate-dependent enzyme [Caldilineaceae bacterium]